MALVLSLAVSGVTLYALQFLQPKKVNYSYKELLSMDKEALISIILQNQQNSGGPGRLVFPLSVIVASVLAALLSFKVCKKASVSVEVVEYLLPPDERKIVSILVEHGGEMKQAELVAFSGINKVKVHRILKKMEERGLIELVPVGKYNIVRLDRHVVEVFKDRFTNSN